MVEILQGVRIALIVILVGASYVATFVLGFCAHSRLVKYYTKEEKPILGRPDLRGRSE